MYKKYENPRTQGTVGTWSRPDPCCKPTEPEDEESIENEENEQSIEDVESDNTIDISTAITINQTATSSGGAGGAGGNGGEGGDAAQASGLIAVALNEVEAGLDTQTIPLLNSLNSEEAVARTAQLQEQFKKRPHDNENGTTASGGDANGGAGGSGGDASSVNYASVTVENVVIINSNVNGENPGYTIGNANRNLEIKVAENGDTFVNGTKMDEQTLGDGTKVLIFRDSKVNNS